MTVNSVDGSDTEASRQRTRDQLDVFTKADPDLLVVTDTGDEADVKYICDRRNITLPPVDPARGADHEDDEVQRLDSYFRRRLDDADDDALVDDDDGTDEDHRWGEKPTARPELGRRYRLPARAVDGQNLVHTLDDIQGLLGRNVAEPEYFLHVAGPRICPATEPAETGLRRPWPRRNPDLTAGERVRVVVVDTGLYQPATKQYWMSDVTGVDEPQPVKNSRGRLRPYAGHGTFVAGVVKAMAPACKLHVLPLHVDPNKPGGGALVDDIVEQLYEALKFRPHLINLSAGTNTATTHGPSKLQRWWDVAHAKFPDLVMVAAAGNDSSPADFWPASFDWAVGVGALDRDGSRSGFSNYGPNVDVYALGRNLVNAFPTGTYVGHERPIRGDMRRFTKMMARWSGTSFSAPIITGLIAAEMSKRPRKSAPKARDAVLRRAAKHTPPWSSTAKTLPPPYSTADESDTD